MFGVHDSSFTANSIIYKALLFRHTFELDLKNEKDEKDLINHNFSANDAWKSTHLN